MEGLGWLWRAIDWCGGTLMAVEGKGLVWKDWDGSEAPLIGVEGLGWLWRAIDWC